MAEPIEDNSAEPILISQPLPNTEIPIQLEVEITNEAGNTGLEIRAVPADQVVQAQRIIASAAGAVEKEQNRAIDEAIKLLYPYAPREGQRNALRQLIYKREDIILIAKTSFGKSMILQATSILVNKSITVVVLPLDQIGQEQAEYITCIGGKPYFLNADTISEKNLADLRDGAYTHLLISPELAIGERFHATATHPAFKERLGLVVVDEAHLVSLWGRDFRTDYAKLGLLRSLFGRHVPWFACSATLNATALKTLKQGLGFGDDVCIMRTSIDRPELMFRTGWIPSGSRQKASALRFIFDEAARTGTETSKLRQIPKTVVFFDSKNEAYAAMQECRKWLQESDKHKYSRKEARETIKVFHRNTAKLDKEAIIAEFQRLAEDSSIRVIFATEALGLGVNLPDVRRVLLYGLPKGEEPAILWQRGGRASRDGKDGEIILLVDEWVEGPRIAPPSIQKACQTHGKSSKASHLLDEAVTAEKQSKVTKLTHAERRGKLPNFWYMLMNETGCLRTRFLDHFDEPQEFRVHIRMDRCCSNCNPEHHLGKLENHYLYCENGNRLNARRKKVLEQITSWAKDQVSVAFPEASFRPTVDCFISADQLTQLAKDAHVITNLDDLRKALGSWYFFQNYGEELLAKLHAAHCETGQEAVAPQASRKAANSIPTSSQNSQGRTTWASVVTSESMNKSSTSQAPPTSKSLVGPTRRPLIMVSENAPIQAITTQDPLPLQELPASKFGRTRKPSRRLMESGALNAI